MLVTREYNRVHAQEYAIRWAPERNPLFTDYTGYGGNCTNFVSQCILAGTCVMNYTPTFGWYYISDSDRSPSWTGVQYFYNFIINNISEGPFGREVNAGGLEIGDVIQLGNMNGAFYHTLIVTGFAQNDYLVSAQSDNAVNRPLSTYRYARIRYIHMLGARIEIPDITDCFNDLIAGTAIL